MQLVQQLSSGYTNEVIVLIRNTDVTDNVSECHIYCVFIDNQRWNGTRNTEGISWQGICAQFVSQEAQYQYLKPRAIG